ncbi:hypothetical protein VFPPC_17363 [Pochonia chlamydosporia 170]|uniref:Uncharacterized protein n=1 Tax=Pochonia chlamydosporia 170 TaxID=1380566 RepID=A0A219ART7_METCM|nr:hypothetical protein VFPPC_17363 [Pochonia chlamydosporia 170]OWT43488.1 hypothetical protein VFPPC_17363 [Pochonia chlamydosporia 170]
MGRGREKKKKVVESEARKGRRKVDARWGGGALKRMRAGYVSICMEEFRCVRCGLGTRVEEGHTAWWEGETWINLMDMGAERQTGVRGARRGVLEVHVQVHVQGGWVKSYAPGGPKGPRGVCGSWN